MKLVDILKKEPQLVQFSFPGEDKHEVIENAVDLFDKVGLLQDKEKFHFDILAREKECTTGVGMGLAIPHARSEGVIGTHFTIFKLKNPVEWRSLDDKKVDLVILLAVSKSEEGGFLKLLSTLSTFLMEEEFQNELRNALSYEEIINTFNTWEER